MENEIWKDVPNYEGYYQVSNLGNVKSLSRKRKAGIENVFAILKERYLTPKDNKHGYLYVDLSKEKNVKRFYIHRLVLMAFLDNYDGSKEVNHINEIKSDNRLCNLELCNHKYNANYGTKIERTKATMIKNDSINKIIMKRNLNGSYGAEKSVIAVKDNIVLDFKSISEASRKLGVSAGHICNCCKGIRNIANGYKFYYKNNLETNDNIEDI